MTPGGLFGALGTEIVWLVVLTGFALVLAIVPAVSSLQRKPVAAPWLCAGGLLAAALVPALARVSVWGWPGIDAEQLRLMHTTFAVVNLAGPLTFGPVAGITLALLAVTGFRAGSWRWGDAALVLTLVALTAGVVAYGGWAANNVLYALIRGAAYLALGVVCAAATLDGDAERGGRDVAAAATATWVLAVAIGEASERGLVMLLLLGTTPTVQPADWGALVDAIRGVVAREWQASVAALATASVVALAGALMARRSRRRVAAASGAFGAVLLAWVVLLAADRGPRALAPLAALCTGTPAPAADGP